MALTQQNGKEVFAPTPPSSPPDFDYQPDSKMPNPAVKPIRDKHLKDSTPLDSVGFRQCAPARENPSLPADIFHADADFEAPHKFEQPVQHLPDEDPSYEPHITDLSLEDFETGDEVRHSKIMCIVENICPQRCKVKTTKITHALIICKYQKFPKRSQNCEPNL